MIIYILIAMLFATLSYLFFIQYRQSCEIDRLKKEHEAHTDEIIKVSMSVAEVCRHIESLEDYLKVIKAETENDKHPDYWASVMNYNPLIHKEPEE